MFVPVVAQFILGMAVLVRPPGMARLIVPVVMGLGLGMAMGMAVLMAMFVGMGMGVGMAVDGVVVGMLVDVDMAVFMGVLVLVLVPAGVVVIMMMTAMHGGLSRRRIATASKSSANPLRRWRGAGAKGRAKPCIINTIA